MGLTLTCQRSAIIDSAVNEGRGVCGLRAYGEQWGQSELAEKIPEAALMCRLNAGKPIPGPLGKQWKRKKKQKNNKQKHLHACGSINLVLAGSGGPRGLLRVVPI